MTDLGTQKNQKNIALLCCSNLALPFHSYSNFDLLTTHLTESVLVLNHI